LAAHCDLTVYSEVPLEKEWLDLEHKYSLRAITSRKLPRRLREMIFFFVLVKDHLKNPFNLLHAHSTYPTGFVAVICQRLLGLPAIVSLHAAEASAFRDIGLGDLLHRRRARINRWVINRARIVTALTDFQRNEVVTNLQIKRPVVVIHRGVDLKQFYFKRSNALRSPVVILSVGYLNAIKDPETLLRAFYSIQKKIQSVLVIVGKDYANGALQKLVDEMGLTEIVRFEGYVRHDLLGEYYRKSDLLLHTSRYESQGMVIAEAMASGVLVVGTRVGLLSDLSGECCLTVPTRDPDALARAVLDLFCDPDKMELLRENAYRWSLHHSLDNCCKEILSLYNQQMRVR
jgi:glycosyltransferase involved in cell wall biosynthesis